MSHLRSIAWKHPPDRFDFPFYARALALTAAVLLPGAALEAQTRQDTLAVLRAVERVIAAPRARPGAEGHLLPVGAPGSLGQLRGLIAETLGQVCVEGIRVEPESKVGAVDLTEFAIGPDTALVRIRTSDGSGTSGTDDLWRFERDARGGWQGIRIGGGSWAADDGRVQMTSKVVFCRGREGSE